MFRKEIKELIKEFVKIERKPIFKIINFKGDVKDENIREGYTKTK